MTSLSDIPPPSFAQPWEWIIFLIIVAVLLLFGPSKLPQVARSIGRALGEFRKGKMDIEREIREEITKEETAEVIATRGEVLRVAKDLAVPTEGRDLKEIKLDIAKAIDQVETAKVVAVARTFGLSVEGVGTQALKEQVIRRLRI